MRDGEGSGCRTQRRGGEESDGGDRDEEAVEEKVKETRWPQRARLCSPDPAVSSASQRQPAHQPPDPAPASSHGKSGLVHPQIRRARWALCPTSVPSANQGAARDRATDRSSSTSRF